MEIRWRRQRAARAARSGRSIAGRPVAALIAAVVVVARRFGRRRRCRRVRRDTVRLTRLAAATTTRSSRILSHRIDSPPPVLSWPKSRNGINAIRPVTAGHCSTFRSGWPVVIVPVVIFFFFFLNVVDIDTGGSCGRRNFRCRWSRCGCGRSRCGGRRTGRLGGPRTCHVSKVRSLAVPILLILVFNFDLKFVVVVFGFCLFLFERLRFLCFSLLTGREMDADK